MEKTVEPKILKEKCLVWYTLVWRWTASPTNKKNLNVPRHTQTRKMFPLADSGAQMVVMGSMHACMCTHTRCSPSPTVRPH